MTMQWVEGASPGVLFNTEASADFMIAPQGPKESPASVYGAWHLLAPSFDYLGNFATLDSAKSACDAWAAKLGIEPSNG